MSHLPNYAQAIIEDSKLLEYALSPESERGRHKAKRFEHILGFNLANWQMLKQAILAALPYHESVLRSETPFGIKYSVSLPIIGANGQKAEVLTVWQFDRQSDGTLNDWPRLVTLYIP